MTRLTARGMPALAALWLAPWISLPGAPGTTGVPSASGPAAAAPAPTVAAAAPRGPETASPARAAPTRPADYLWPFIRLQGTDYVSVDDVAKHYGLKPAWTKRDIERTLSDARGVRYRLEANQRDCYLDGARVFLGAPVLSHKDELWISKLDVIKTIAPLFRPEDHARQLPAGPPKLILLDAGHGGSDPGKQNFKLKLDEKDVTLDVVLRLKQQLELRGYTVRLTRATDTKLAPDQRADLERRAALANELKADLFLSIHFNAVDARDAARVTGTETYVMTPQFQFSSTDNSGDALTARAFPGNRQDVANVILGYRLHRRLLSELKTSDRGFKRGRLRVLCFPECPAALLEAAYLSNDAEAARLGTAAFRQQIAEAVADGVDDYRTLLATVRLPPPPAPPEK